VYESRRAERYVVGGFLFKRYNTSQLLDKDSSYLSRIDLINSFEYQNYPCLTPTYISVKNDTVLYKQKFIIKSLVNHIDHGSLCQLSKTLDYLERIGFVHGDLNRKNIIKTIDGYKVIDFEPSLIQFRNGREALVTTPPYYSMSEYSKGRLTSLSDKIGFYYFIMRLLGTFNNKKLSQLLKNRDHSVYLDEEELKQKSFFEILEYSLVRNLN
jgi:serine/threonine protein kinase